MQERYEDLVAKYAAQSKTKEPSALREDAYQLYSVRMSYIQAAGSYSIAISNFRTACDRTLVSAFAGFADKAARLQLELSKDVAAVGKEMRKILAWNTEMTVSAKSLQDKLYVTKQKLEKEVSEMVQPKRDLGIYQTFSLPVNGKNGSTRQIKASISGSPVRRRAYSLSEGGKPSKQGWLFQRIVTGKPARNTWVRRWFFVKDGTFGWLQNSAKTAAVEESEKVGVLLCNVRPIAAEDRRFCFEVMTKSTNYMLQAETEEELSDWINVFEIAMKAILQDEKEYPQAFAITAPSHAEFAAPTDEHDRHSNLPGPGLAAPQPTTPRASFDIPPSSGGAREASRSIVAKLENRLKDRPKPSSPGPQGGIASLVAASQSALVGQHVPIHQLPISQPRPVDINDSVTKSNIAPDTLALPPISTQMSTRAVQARSRAVSTASANAPSGIMANSWGSVHWGLVGIDDENENQSKQMDFFSQAQGSADTNYEKSIKAAITPGSPKAQSTRTRRSSTGRSQAKSTSSVDMIPVTYPSDYPGELRKHDGQFRTLFPAARPDEFVLLVCRVMWQPVDGQQLWGRMYATDSGLHFFAHAQGMVCVQTIPFSDIVRISHHFGGLADKIVIERNGMDPVDAKVYLDSANLVTRRVDLLFRNSLSDQPMNPSELLQQIKLMEEENLSDDEESGPIKATEEYSVSRPVNSVEGAYGEDISKIPPQILRRKGEIVKIVLPDEPVICGCQDHLGKRFAEYVFQVPAKSLFHLMFGDNTPVWKNVYKSRRVNGLDIAPWKEAEKQLVREYTYVVEYTDTISRIILFGYA